MEWQRIGRAAFRRRMTLVGTGVGAPMLLSALFYGGWFLARLPFGGLPVPLQVLLSAGLTTAIVVAAIAVAALFYRGLEATSDGARVRLGRKEVASDALDGAWLWTAGSNRRDQLILRLGAGKRHTQLWLREKQRVMLTDDERALLIRVLEASAIAPPTSSYDPTGRFARYNFPGSLRKQEAIDLVRTVPMPGDRLPITG